MAEVVELRPHESPPEGSRWALVERRKPGDSATDNAVAVHTMGRTFSVPHDATEAELQDAVSRAQAWADQQGIPTVHVREG